MKRLLLLIILSFLCCGLSAQTGPWSGKLSAGGTTLTIVFHLDDNCTMDSPDQGAKGIKAEKSVSPDGKIVISVPSIGASFEGFYLLNTIVGEFSQSGFKLPLTLKPGEPKLNRPQTPVAPFPYATEEVSFNNGDAVLRGTLTMPRNCGKETPAVLLVTGSGLQNRDEEIYGHKPFAVIADALARAGIATLRYDDRGFGESTGDVTDFTTEDLKNDALAGIVLLRKRFSRVGVAGHSEGGTIAFLLAAEKKVDFVISLAGGIIPMKETLIRQNRDALGKAGLAPEDVEEYCNALSKAFDAIIQGERPENIDGTSLPDALKQNFKAAVQQSSTKYMRYFIGLDVRKILDKVDCPVLAFNGTLDSQVDCKANLGALEKGLSPETAIITEVQNANHLFQHCKTGDVSEYKEIEETFAPEVLERTIKWINQNFSR